MQETFLVRRKTLYAILGVRLSKIWNYNFTKRKETTSTHILLSQCKSYSYLAHIYFYMLKKNTHYKCMMKQLNEASLNSLIMLYILFNLYIKKLYSPYTPVGKLHVSYGRLLSIILRYSGCTGFYIMHELYFVVICLKNDIKTTIYRK